MIRGLGASASPPEGPFSFALPRIRSDPEERADNRLWA
jgi:hypothetical protein